MEFILGLELSQGEGRGGNKEHYEPLEFLTGEWSARTRLVSSNAEPLCVCVCVHASWNTSK